MSTFSRRYGYAGQAAPITVREDAPIALRHAVVQIAAEEGFSTPSKQRKLICRVLRKMPDRNNWSEDPNVAEEVDDLISSCDWYRVYDIAEEFYAEIEKSQQRFFNSIVSAANFESKLNEILFEQGIGWKMEHGRIMYRGEEPFEQAVLSARHMLQQSNRTTARNEIAEALLDLSRRPVPDRTGAVQHSMAALECLVRDISGDSKQTLGALLKRHKNTLDIPPPLDVAVEKMWGYASEFGRHLQEGHEPSPEEAELVTMVCAAVVTYLVRKQGSGVGCTP